MGLEATEGLERQASRVGTQKSSKQGTDLARSVSWKDHSCFSVWNGLEEGRGEKKKNNQRPFRKVLQVTLVSCLKEVAVEKENTVYICEVLQVDLKWRLGGGEVSRTRSPPQAWAFG